MGFWGHLYIFFFTLISAIGYDATNNEVDAAEKLEAMSVNRRQDSMLMIFDAKTGSLRKISSDEFANAATITRLKLQIPSLT